VSSSVSLRPVVRPVRGVVMVVIAATIWALNGTVSKLLLKGGFDALQLTTLRATGSFFGLLAVCAVLRPGLRRMATTRRELPRLIIFGFLGLFMVPLLYFVAISRLPVGIGLLFEFTAPVFLALWVRFGEHQQVRRRLWVGLTLCVVGLVAVAQIWTGSLRLDPIGIAAGMSSAVLLACYYVLGAKSVSSRDPISLTCWAFGVAALAGAVIRPWWHFPAAVLTGSSDGVPMWLLTIYLLVLGTIVPYLLITTAMRHLPPTSVGIIGMTELVLATIFAWVLLHEVLSTTQVLGGLVLLAGVILAETARAARAARTESADGTDRAEGTEGAAPAAGPADITSAGKTSDHPNGQTDDPAPAHAELVNGWHAASPPVTAGAPAPDIPAT
jgi:drug/metabolite transporter (DMT)-like permease